MSENDISVISTKIDDEKDYLRHIGHRIWENPELNFEETFAHGLLTEALEKYEFDLQRHYKLPTAFRGEFCNTPKSGPTIAILCEYDALPEIGHACGHNLIAEAGIAAGMAAKAAMEADTSIPGKIVILGTPAEEGGFGKMRLVEHGAFDDIDMAMMVHPVKNGCLFPQYLCLSKVTVTYLGKETHASAYPWEGKNALDAAVACYNNVALLRQQMKPNCKIHGIITKGGAAPNIIPGETEMNFFIRAPTIYELTVLKTRVDACFESAALATGCDVKVNFSPDNYEDLISNEVLAAIFKEHAESYGLEFAEQAPGTGGSTDMGNISHIVPSIHPVYSIGGNCVNHTKAFVEQVVTEEAQVATLAAAKALAIVAIKMLKYPELFQNAKKNFRENLFKGDV